MADPKVSGVKPLTATQTAVLAAAALRADDAIVLPGHLRGGAASKLVSALLTRGIAREVSTRKGLPAWRRDPLTAKSYTLLITRNGRAVMGIQADASEDLSRVGAQAEKSQEADTSTSTNTAAASPLPLSGAVAPRPASKLSHVIDLLAREHGAAIEELTTATGWLPHTTRAALTGLRKRGYAVTRESLPDGEGTVYRVRLTP